MTLTKLDGANSLWGRSHRAAVKIATKAIQDQKILRADMWNLSILECQFTWLNIQTRFVLVKRQTAVFFDLTRFCALYHTYWGSCQVTSGVPEKPTKRGAERRKK